MEARVNGFTLIEVVIVIVIGLILTSMAVTAFAPAQRQLSVRSARDALVGMHARTRAHAVEAGQTTILTVNFATDRASITRNGTVLESVDFREEMNVDLTGGASPLQICMNSRGFGEASCNSFTAGTELRFVMHDESAILRVYPLGQVILP